MTADHGIADGVVYGPQRSRRYGRTIGINLLPAGDKRCDWNCVYCQLGYTDYHRRPDGFPAVADVVAALDQAPRRKVDALVICGNGEPTLHPDFGAVIAALRGARDRRFPGVPLVCLTNGGELWSQDVVRALKTLDEVAVKLDAGDCDTLARVNMPQRPACVVHQVRGIKRLHGCVVQACFVTGAVDNTGSTALTPWLSAVERAMPCRVDIYTVARPTPSGKVRPVLEGRLREIGAVTARRGLSVRVFGAGGELCRGLSRPGAFRP